MDEIINLIIGNVLSSLFLQTAKYTTNQKDLAVLMQNGCSFQTFAPSQKLISCGTAVNKVFILVNGSCLIVCHNQDGKASVQDSLQAPQIFGLTELISEQQSYSASVIGDRTGMVLAIPSALFLRAIRHNLATDQAVIKYLTYLARRNMDAWECCNLYAPKDALSLHLYDWSKDQQLPYTLKMGRLDLAEFLHIQLRSLYRYLDDLKKQGLCCVVNGKITITEANFRALENYCSIIAEN
ncbi:MAG: hypothetical protein CVU91_05475 [Firmicutes bacterium HGW-Firmicutes-16]|nr:MAG: hypothetical protein CVU91_05475 [Firmicutes bacterium HGW-Firmicutes-16]